MYVRVADVIQFGLKHVLLFVLAERIDTMLNEKCLGSPGPAVLP